MPFPTDPKFFDGLVKYQSTVNLERWFCRRCGASICNYDRSDEDWEFCTGAIDALGETENGKGCLDGKLNRAYMWAYDTIDGGGVSWLNEGKADGLDGRYLKGRDSEQVTDEILAGMEGRGKEVGASTRGHMLNCRCHCGEIDFNVLPPKDGGKYGGLLCACTTCRKTCGFEITSWTHVPLENLTIKTQDPHLGHYSSSEGRRRYFCKRCGASIMFAADGMQTGAVVTGIFDPKAGARAEAWLKWNPRGDGVGVAEDAIDKDFARRLAVGIQRKTRQT